MGGGRHGAASAVAFVPLSLTLTHSARAPRPQLPYDYYSLPFCRPADMTNAVENLGEVLHSPGTSWHAGLA